MKTRKNILVTGMVVAAVLVAGVSVYAAGDVVESTVDKVVERFGGQRGGMNHRGAGGPTFEKAVEEGIMTQEEADNIIEFVEANRPDMEAIQDELDGLTRDEVRTYMEENHPKADLVEEGLLTQEQADLLEAQRPEFDGERPQMQGGMKGNRQQGAKSFDAAIEAGILDDEDVENIQAYHEANRPDKDALEAELDGLTRDEVRTYMEENYPRSEDPLGDLVENDIITQEQANQLDELRAERPEFDGERPEGRGGMKGGRGMRPGATEDSSVEGTSL